MNSGRDGPALVKPWHQRINQLGVWLAAPLECVRLAAAFAHRLGACSAPRGKESRVPGGVFVAPGVLRSTGAGSESGSKQPHSKGADVRSEERRVGEEGRCGWG